MSPRPLVSVIIPIYNGEKYLEETLASVFSQTHDNYEIIAVDDGSAVDASEKICKKYKDRVAYVYQKNRGLSATRNAAIKMSRGDYLAFIDQDDVWLPDKLEKQINFFESLKAEGKTAGLIYTGLQYIDEDGRNIYKILFKSFGDNYRILLYKNFIGTPSSVLIHKSILDDVGSFDEAIKASSDWDLWLRIAAKYSIYSLDEMLTKYRVSPHSLSTDIKQACYDREYILNKVISVNSRPFFFDHNSIGDIKKHHKMKFATVWKNTAYDYLFNRSDGKSFRRNIQIAYTYNRSILTVPTAFFYFFSYISADFCKLVKSLKPNRSKLNNSDIIIDVSNLKKMGYDD